jgi:hypothetical protein
MSTPVTPLLGRTTAVEVERLAPKPLNAAATDLKRVGVNSLHLLLFLLLAPCSLLPGGDAAPPAVNWVLPIFTDKEGYRSMTLRGSEVRPVGRIIAVTDLSITIFSGDVATMVDSILLSPSAVFLPKENRARGDKSVRFIRDDFEVVGVGWTYDHTTKKVSLQQNVRVTFRAQLNDILK